MISIPPLRIFWDLPDEPDGNVCHIGEHGIEPAEVEEVLRSPTAIDVSRSTGRRIAIGETTTGRMLLVVFEEIDESSVYPITAYELEG